jgi:hypothetical protein
MAGQRPAQSQTVYLPPAAGATPLSAEIHAQASYLVGMGYFLESAAMARKIHAEAASIEIDNWVKYTKAYWQRKGIWEREWHKRHPSPVERQQALDKLWDQIISHPDWAGKLHRAVSDDLNELLVRLTGPKISAQYTGRGEAELNLKLTARDREQIWLNDGGRGSRLVFCLAHPQALDAQWPFCLTAPEFESERKKYEQARDAAMEEVRKPSGRISYERGTELLHAVNELLLAVEREYPSDRRRDVKVFMEYSEAKQFLGTLLQQVARAIKTNDRALFDEKLGFQGETLVDLLQYMYSNGLRFEKPKAGGEGVYGRLFSAMRDLYLVLKEQQAE